MKNLFEIVYYCGDNPLPSYHVIDWLQSDTIKDDLNERLTQIVNRVRTVFNVESSIPDEKIHEELYLLQESTILSIKDIHSLE